MSFRALYTNIPFGSRVSPAHGLGVGHRQPSRGGQVIPVNGLLGQRQRREGEKDAIPAVRESEDQAQAEQGLILDGRRLFDEQSCDGTVWVVALTVQNRARLWRLTSGWKTTFGFRPKRYVSGVRPIFKP